MTKARILGVFRLGFASLALAALTTILVSSLRRESFDPINFFSFFTIESNLLAAALLFVTGVAALRGEPGRFMLLRGAATLYMTMTGIIYVLLLRGLEAALQLPIPWVNAVLHYVMPLVILGDWVFAPSTRVVSFHRALVWLLYPVLYVAYSLLRGAVTGWYPYPFLNAAVNGYGAVALTCLVMLVGIALLAGLLALRTRGRGSRVS